MGLSLLAVSTCFSACSPQPSHPTSARHTGPNRLIHTPGRRTHRGAAGAEGGGLARCGEAAGPDSPEADDANTGDGRRPVAVLSGLRDRRAGRSADRGAAPRRRVRRSVED